MPAPEGWLKFIADLLKREGSGPRDKRVEVYRLAQKMAEADGPYELGLCNLFSVWVSNMRYLETLPRSVTYGLPQDVMQRQPGQTARDWEARVESRAVRVKRCADMLRNGMDDNSAVNFVSSEEEWIDAKRMSRETQEVENAPEIVEKIEEQHPFVPEQRPFEME